MLCGSDIPKQEAVHPFTGEVVSTEKRLANASESIRWYQILTASSDPVMLRNRMMSMGLLTDDNDPTA